MNSLRYKKLAGAVAACLTGGIGTVLFQPVHAQEADEIVVTGSFIERPADRPQPITVLSNEDLRLQQRSSIAEVVKDLPQSIGSTSMINSQQGGVNVGNSPTATINLRGLGPRATLVLLNGTRQTTDGGFGFVDINNLAPSIMIERIEILTDGASALYGSDAVAGVANFITRNNFDGMEFRVETQRIQDTPGGKPDVNVGALFGSQGERTRLVAGFDYATTESLLVEDRYDDERLHRSLSSGFGNPATFSIQNLNGTQRPATAFIPDPLCGSELIGGGIRAGELNPAGNQCLLYNSLGRTIQPESKRLVGLSTLSHDVNDKITAQLELGFARTRYEIPFGYMSPASTVPAQLALVPIDNPGVLAAVAADPNFRHPNSIGAPDANIAGYRYRGRVRSPIAGGPSLHDSSQDTFRIVAKLDGAFGESGWDWQAAFSDSWNDTHFTDNDTFRERLQAAVNGYGGPACPGAANDPTGTLRGRGACQFWNPFANSLLAQPGDANYNDPAIVDWMTGGRETLDSGTLKTYDFIVTGDLWDMAGGTTGIAVGLQRRDQSFSQTWDESSKTVGVWAFWGGTAYLDFEGERSTDAAFVELGMFPTETVEIQVAGRYERMAGIDSFDPKLGVVWTPKDGLYFRASAGTSFRQPGEIQMFGIGPGGASTGVIGGDTINARGLLVGNQSLRAETSDNWTAGVTWDITERATMELNYWSVKFKDLITQENAAALLTVDMADGFINFPQFALRSGASNEICEITGRWSGRPADPRPDDCMSGFDIELVTLSYINQDFQTTSGLDFVFSYDWEALSSEWNVRLLGSWTHEYDMTVLGNTVDGVGSYNLGTFGVPNPEWRANVMLGWSKDRHSARVTARYLSKLDNNAVDANNFLTEETAFTTIDALYSYALPSGRSDVTFSVTNLFDEEDPLRHGVHTTSTSNIYETRGRMFRLGMDWGF